MWLLRSTADDRSGLLDPALRLCYNYTVPT